MKTKIIFALVLVMVFGSACKDKKQIKSVKEPRTTVDANGNTNTYYDIYVNGTDGKPALYVQGKDTTVIDSAEAIRGLLFWTINSNNSMKIQARRIDSLELVIKKFKNRPMVINRHYDYVETLNQ